MATSSFDSIIKINKNSANSLIEILDEENYGFVDLSTKIEVNKVNSADVSGFFSNKTEKKQNK